MKKVIEFLRKGFLQNVVIVLYFVTLAGEGYLLYYRNYYTRIYTRPTLLPMLFLIYLQQFISRNHLLLLGAMIAACLGDYLTIEFIVFHQWIGLGCYAFSFLLVALQFFKFEWFSLKTSKMATFISLVGLFTYYGIMEYFLRSHNLFITNKVLIYLYAASIAVLSTSVLNIYFNNKANNYKFAVIAVLFLVLANICFESSIFYFHRRVTWIDVITATLYGLYQFFIVKGIIRSKDKIMGTEYFKQI